MSKSRRTETSRKAERQENPLLEAVVAARSDLRALVMDAGFVEAQGQVTNISSGSLRNVTAVVTFLTASGDFITSTDALIDFNPILPGQTSPWSVITTWNPAMQSARVEFKDLLGPKLNHRVK